MISVDGSCNLAEIIFFSFSWLETAWTLILQYLSVLTLLKKMYMGLFGDALAGTEVGCNEKGVIKEINKICNHGKAFVSGLRIFLDKR